MKILATLSIIICTSLISKAQDFAGIRTGNYSGVSSVFANPANIADSRHRWDFNLFGLSAAIANNKASFKLKDIGKVVDTDSLKNSMFSQGNGNSSGFASAVVQGPSVFFNLNKKSAIALTTRARMITNIIDIDSKFAQQFINEEDNNSTYPYSISSADNMVVNANGWTELGLSYAREISNEGKHYFKGGISLKYLAGAGHASVNINNLNATINNDVTRDETYLSNTSGSIGLSFGGMSIDDFEPKDLLKFNSKGIGADIGFVYEYRPDTASWNRNDLNKYKFKIGLAILDLGSIKYERDLTRSASYGIKITGSQRFYLSSLSDAGIDNYKDTLDKYPQFFPPDASGNAASYNTALPTTLQLNADYHFHKGFYVNLAAQFGLTNSGSKAYASQYYNAVAVTPRFENKLLGVYLPLSYNALSQFTAGASFRVGGFFFGSGSVLSAALGNSKQADFFIGLHFGSLYRSK
jgi:hypothetical protein